MGWFSDTFNPGKKYRKQAARALQRAQFKGGNMTTAGGLSAGFSFGDNGEFYSRQSLGDFAPLFQRLLGMSGDFFDKATTGAAEVAERFDPNMQALQAVFGSSADIASQDPLERGGEVTDLLRARRLPSARNEINRTFERLFQSGGLSNQVTREQVLDAESRRLGDEDLGYQLAGIQQGEQSVQNAFTRMMGAQGGMQGMLGFLEAMQGQDLQRGMAALGGAQALNAMPMDLMRLVAGLQATRSNVGLGQAAGFNEVGKNAQSTFMNFTNWLQDTAQKSVDLYKGI